MRDSNDMLFVVYVHRSHRYQGAPFFGKWVTVDFQDENGVCPAVGFRSAR